MSSFKLKCNSCKKISVHYCSDLNWGCVESEERGMGSENHYEASWEDTCNCGQHRNLVLHCWEYPMGAANTTDYDVEGAELDDSDCESCPDFPGFTEEDDEH
jgi:hypothetical protein